MGKYACWLPAVYHASSVYQYSLEKLNAYSNIQKYYYDQFEEVLLWSKLDTILSLAYFIMREIYSKQRLTHLCIKSCFVVYRKSQSLQKMTLLMQRKVCRSCFGVKTIRNLTKSSPSQLASYLNDLHSIFILCSIYVHA